MVTAPRVQRPERARVLRSDPTEMEKRLWRALRMRQLDGARFRRQVPIGPYIADFVCVDAALIIEVDGGQHANETVYDERRAAWLEERGWRVLRFWNNEIDGNLEGVLDVIRRELSPSGGFPHPDPPPQAREEKKRP
jgi:very-short-patch-repair endonuclease